MCEFYVYFRGIFLFFFVCVFCLTIFSSLFAVLEKEINFQICLLSDTFFTAFLIAFQIYFKLFYYFIYFRMGECSLRRSWGSLAVQIKTKNENCRLCATLISSFRSTLNDLSGWTIQSEWTNEPIFSRSSHGLLRIRISREQEFNESIFHFSFWK